MRRARRRRAGREDEALALARGLARALGLAHVEPHERGDVDAVDARRQRRRVAAVHRVAVEAHEVLHREARVGGLDDAHEVVAVDLHARDRRRERAERGVAQLSRLASPPGKSRSNTVDT